jgi:hypothetical protein
MQWDYAALQIDEPDLGELLTRMGDDAWELVTVWQSYFIFKREHVAGTQAVTGDFLALGTARMFQQKRSARWGYRTPAGSITAPFRPGAVAFYGRFPVCASSPFATIVDHWSRHHL